jgi:biopolymer transport protein ExbD/biopolymer transport protein TolR
MNDLPEINLKIHEADRKISGAMVFYFQEREDPNGPWHVTGESAVPLLAPHVKGNTLTFEVQHQRCHGCSELGPNAKFRVALAGSNEARLWKLDKETDSGPGLKLIRQTGPTVRSAQTMQKGISVQLPVASNAVAMPDADQEDSLIVTITDEGSVYLGVDPISPAALAENVRRGLTNRAEKKLFIKADARTPYANVVKVLDAVRTQGVEATDLLIAQRDSSEPGTVVPPQGLEVLIGPSLRSGSEAIVVQVLNAGQRRPALKIDNEQIPWTTLQSTLRKLFQNRREKMVLVKAEGTLPFNDVVEVTDAARSTGAKVFLVTPGL